MHPSSRLSIALALAVALSPALAIAQSAPSAAAPPAGSAKAQAKGGDDEVSLKNGGMIRGTVVSVEPKKEVVILVQGTGEQRRIPWAEVGKVERGKYASTPPAESPPPEPSGAVVGGVNAAPAPAPVDPAAAPAPSPAPSPEPSPAPLPGAPRLHIESGRLVTLHEVTMSFGVVGSGGSAYGMLSQVQCQSPCDKVIDGRSGQAFFVAGDGIPSSSTFQLGDKAGDVTLRVRPGSTGLRGGGIALITVGGIAFATGGSLLLAGALVQNFDESGSAKTPSSLPAVGGVTMGIGAAMLVGGIVMAALSGTNYEFRSGAIPGTVRF